MSKLVRLLKHARKCGQEPQSLTGWHLLVFPIETSKSSNPLSPYIIKKKACVRLCNGMSGKRVGNISVNCSVQEKVIGQGSSSWHELKVMMVVGAS